MVRRVGGLEGLEGLEGWKVGNTKIRLLPMLLEIEEVFCPVRRISRKEKAKAPSTMQRVLEFQYPKFALALKVVLFVRTNQTTS